MKSVLITGYKGFIGKNLFNYLKGKYVVKGIDMEDNICFHQATRKFDYVVHCAAQVSVVKSMVFPIEDALTNIIGTLNILKQHPDSKIIYLSTSCSYGEGYGHTEESPVNPQSAYAISKLCAEYYIKIFSKDWVILRLGNVVGKGTRGEPNVYMRFQKDSTLTIFGDGKQTRDYVDVKVVCRAIEKSFEAKGVFNIGSGSSKSVLEVAAEFDKPFQFAPKRTGEVHDFGLDITKAKKGGLL